MKKIKDFFRRTWRRITNFFSIDMIDLETTDNSNDWPDIDIDVDID